MADPAPDLTGGTVVDDLLRRLGRGPRPSEETRRHDGWPAPMEKAYRGLAGDVVAAVDAHSEADPVATLATYLAMFGCAAGRTPRCLVGDARHGSNLSVLLVGETAKARKGTSEAFPRRILTEADPEWGKARVVSGLSSGEGLIWAVRDPIEKTEPVKEKGQVTGYQTVVVDQGVADKRLLVIEEEFASTLKVAGREGNTLSPVIRQAWDGKDLRVLTKNSPAVATAPHVGVIGHISKAELLRHLDGTEAAGGTMNRFLLFCVRRSKCLPEGGRVPDGVAQELVRRTGEALAFARRTAVVERDGEARELWAEVYPDLSEGRPGLLGAVTARAEAQVLRLSLLYALLDRSGVVTAEHLLAALDVWDHALASARFVFGDATGDPVADKILRHVRRNGPQTQNDLVDLLGRHTKGSEIARATGLLAAAGLIVGVREETGGRPRTVWVAAEGGGR